MVIVIRQLLSKASFSIVKFVLFTTRILPENITYAGLDIIAYLGSSVKWKRKEIALKNLSIVFPEKTEKEKKQIFKDSLRKSLKYYVEIIMLVSKKYSAKDILSLADCEGLENLDNIRDREVGALLYTGHIGNFPLMAIWLALKGYPIAAIYKEAKNFPDDFYGNIMRSYNVIPLKYNSDAALTVSIIKALKQKKIVLIQNDQSDPNGIYINFFNKWVPSATGPAILAKRTAVPIIPAYIFRDKKKHHTIRILPEFILTNEKTLELFIEKNIQLLVNWIAEIIRKHPTEWFWLHNRWKREKVQT